MSGRTELSEKVFGSLHVIVSTFHKGIFYMGTAALLVINPLKRRIIFTVPQHTALTEGRWIQIHFL